MLLDDFALAREITEADIKSTHRLQQLAVGRERGLPVLIPLTGDNT